MFFKEIQQRVNGFFEPYIFFIAFVITSQRREEDFMASIP